MKLATSPIPLGSETSGGSDKQFADVLCTKKSPTNQLTKQIDSKQIFILNQQEGDFKCSCEFVI